MSLLRPHLFCRSCGAPMRHAVVTAHYGFDRETGTPRLRKSDVEVCSWVANHAEGDRAGFPWGGHDGEESYWRRGGR